MIRAHVGAERSSRSAVGADHGTSLLRRHGFAHLSFLRRKGGLDFLCLSALLHAPLAPEPPRPMPGGIKPPQERPGQVPCAAGPRSIAPTPACLGWAIRVAGTHRHSSSTGPHRCRIPYSAGLPCRSCHAAGHRGGAELRLPPTPGKEWGASMPPVDDPPSCTHRIFPLLGKRRIGWGDPCSPCG